MGLAVRPYEKILVREKAAVGGQHRAPVQHKAPDPGEGLVPGAVELREDQQPVRGPVRLPDVDDIALQIHLVEGGVELIDQAVVVLPLPVGPRGEAAQGVEGLLAHHHGDTAAFFQARQLGGQLRQLPPQALHLPVGGTRLPVMAQHALPEAFQPPVEGEPGPVHDPGGPGGDVAQGHQPELSRIGEPAGTALGLALQHQVILLFQRAHHVPGEGDLPAGEGVGAGAVDVRPHHGQRPGCGKLVHIRLDSLRVAPLLSGRLQGLPVKVEVVGDELVLPLQLPHQPGLPFEKLRGQGAAVGLKGAGVAGAGGGGGVRQLLKGGGGIAPVVQAESCVQGGDIGKAAFHPFPEAVQHPLALRPVVLCLIVQLVADDVGISGGSCHRLPDDLLRAAPVGRVRQVEILPGAEAVSVQHPGGELRQPAGDGVGGGAHNHPDVPGRRRLDHPQDVGEIVDAVGRLRHGPGGFPDPDGIDARLLHQLHIPLHPPGGEIFLIIRRAEDQLLVHGPLLLPLFLFAFLSG